jgi:acyl-coenzyme A synthetase/AMP-(fatty) acid ligase
MPNALVSAFEARVRRDAAAQVVVSASAALSAGALADLAAAVAPLLPAFEPGSLVALQAPNGPAFLAGWLALLRRGAAPLLCDHRQPASEARRAASALGAIAILSPSEAWPKPERFEWTALDAKAPITLEPGVGAVKLTSGSTGAPRGVVCSAQALLADDEQLWSTMALGPRGQEERLLTTIPLSHSYGLSSLAVPALRRRAVLVLPDEPGPFAPFAAARALGATFFPTAPAWLAAIARLDQPPELAPSVRRVIAAGEPLRAEVAERLRRSIGLRAHVFYGSSESGGITYDREGGAAERGTVGTPVDGVTVTLRDDRVVVSSPALATRYLPDAGADLVGGRFTTADLAEWTARGELRLLGRADDRVFIRGKAINPNEIEAVLRRLPGVEDAAVFAAPDAPGGEQRLRAVIAGATDAATAIADCRRHLAEPLVPRRVVVVAHLPRTERGKIDRPALRALFDH